MKSTTIDEACDLVTDGTHYTPKDAGAGIPFLTVKDVTDNLLDFVGCSFITEEEYRAAERANSAPRRGDVLFSKDGTVGKVHVVETGALFAVLSSLAILRPKLGRVEPSYLGHALRAPAVLNEALKRKTGSAIRRIVLSDLKRVSFPLPSLLEQRRIAEILDKADALRAKRRAALAQLDTLTQSIFLDMFGDPATNPKGFQMSTVGRVAEQVTDGEHLTPKRAKTGIKLLSARNIRDGYIDFDNVDYIGADEYERIKRRCSPSMGDVLISCSGSIGRVASVQTHERFSLVRSAALVRPRTSEVRSKFLEHYLRTPTLNSLMVRRANASSQANLFQGQIRELPVYLPPLPIQDSFTLRVDSVGRLEFADRTSLAELDALFASLQHRAFRGEL